MTTVSNMGTSGQTLALLRVKYHRVPLLLSFPNNCSKGTDCIKKVSLSFMT